MGSDSGSVWVASYRTGKAAEEALDRDFLDEDDLLPSAEDIRELQDAGRGGSLAFEERKESAVLGKQRERAREEEQARLCTTPVKDGIFTGACNIPIQLVNCGGEELAVIRKGTYLELILIMSSDEYRVGQRVEKKKKKAEVQHHGRQSPGMR